MGQHSCWLTRAINHLYYCRLFGSFFIFNTVKKITKQFVILHMKLLLPSASNKLYFCHFRTPLYHFILLQKASACHVWQKPAFWSKIFLILYSGNTPARRKQRNQKWHLRFQVVSQEFGTRASMVTFGGTIEKSKTPRLHLMIVIWCLRPSSLPWHMLGCEGPLCALATSCPTKAKHCCHVCQP